MDTNKYWVLRMSYELRLILIIANELRDRINISINKWIKMKN